ncbi:MAG: hypothetical protein L0241_28800 [Planctomycetia bacterium]|nr:hypothetical protein [Planctomycetia bacterium]
MFRIFAIVALFVLPSVACAQQPEVYAPSVPQLSGTWSGYWISDTNGHNGPLHARIRPISPDEYRVTFRGRYRVVIPFRYTTTMDVVGTGDGVIVLAAERPVGRRGTFRMNATVTSTDFNATFNSRRDHGRFVLTRR